MSEQRLIETAWRLRGPVGRIIQCTIYMSDAGFVVQLGATIEDASRTCTVRSLTRARKKAAEWRTALLTLSEFAEVDASHHSDRPL